MDEQMQTDPSLPAAPQGAPPRRPDPGSRTVALLAWLILVPVVLVVAGLQQCSVVVATQRADASARSTVPPPAPGDAFTLSTRIMLAGASVLEDLGATPGQIGQVQESVDQSAVSPTERVRAAAVAGRLLDADAARERLEQAAEAVLAAQMHENGLSDEAGAQLLNDIDAMDRLYAGETIADAEAAALVDRHGLFGELALTQRVPEADRAEAARAVVGGAVFLLVFIGFGGLVLAALVTGFVLFIVGCVMLGSGRLRSRFVPPAPGGSMHLETMAAFVVAFLLLQVVGGLVGLVVADPAATFIALGMQWLLVPVAAWPVMRGVPWREWREQVGLVAPRGVLREVGAGFVGYLAGLPILVLGAAVSMVLLFAREFVRGLQQAAEGGAAEPVVGPSGPVNPMFEMLGAHGVAGLIMFGLLATVWAPLVEELVLRGALYRHLRGRLHWIVAGVFSALIFGVLHQYDVVLLGPVIALGVIFAMLREWRGSLIAAITGHALHNGTIVALIAVLVGVG
ncbi:MAG: CPBP family intramembrane glutamic endopeptidase [Planctomycetota bacterium]